MTSRALKEGGSSGERLYGEVNAVQVPDARALGPLEVEVMDILWEDANRPITVGSLHGKLYDPQDRISYNAVKHVLQRLVAKQLIAQVPDSRPPQYLPIATRHEHETEVVLRTLQHFQRVCPGALAEASHQL